MSQTTSVNELLKSAQDEGILSAASMNAIQIANPGAQIQHALGVDVDDVEASEVVLVTQLIDDSGSIRFAGNAQAVRDGHNEVLDALDKAKQKDGVLAHTRYLNGNILYAYSALEDTEQMTNSNYDPNGGTPLYDQMLVILGTVLAKVQEFSDNGVPARSVTLVITDGEDMHSAARASSVKAVVEDMLRQENHIIAGMGICDNKTDFRQVFQDMGIQDKWILTPSNSDKEIREAFRLFSQSAVQASQSGASFSQMSLGGFGN